MKKRVISTISFTIDGKNENDIYDKAQDIVYEMSERVSFDSRAEADFDFEEIGVSEND